MNYNIGEIAEITGFATHTLRYYEKEGMIYNIERKENGLRTFNEKNINQLKVISCLKETGMGIEDIKKHIDIIKNPDESNEKRRDIFISQREKLLSKISELQGFLEMAEYKIWFYENLEEYGDITDPLNCQKMKALYEKQNKIGLK